MNLAAIRAHVQEAEDAYNVALADRADAVRQAYESGMSMARIAVELGINRQRVYQIYSAGEDK